MPARTEWQARRRTGRIDSEFTGRAGRATAIDHATVFVEDESTERHQGTPFNFTPPGQEVGTMLQAILSRIYYNIAHPNTPMAIMPLVEEQFREQQRKQTQAWKMIERLECPECGKVYSAPYLAHCRNCGMELISRVEW